MESTKDFDQSVRKEVEKLRSKLSWWPASRYWKGTSAVSAYGYDFRHQPSDRHEHVSIERETLWKLITYIDATNLRRTPERRQVSRPTRAAPLLSLPTELLCHIASFLTIGQLPALLATHGEFTIALTPTLYGRAVKDCRDKVEEKEVLLHRVIERGLGNSIQHLAIAGIDVKATMVAFEERAHIRREPALAFAARLCNESVVEYLIQTKTWTRQMCGNYDAMLTMAIFNALSFRYPIRQGECRRSMEPDFKARPTVVKLLIEAGADVNAEQCSTVSKGEHKDRLLNVRCKPVQYAAVGTSKDSAEVLELLLKAGADPNATGNCGYSAPPLYLASKPDVIAMLVKHGADTEHRLPNSYTPLLAACTHASNIGFVDGNRTYDRVEALLKNGADANATTLFNDTVVDETEVTEHEFNVIHLNDHDLAGRSALMNTVRYVRDSPLACRIITLLLEHGAKLGRDVLGRTTLMHALAFTEKFDVRPREAVIELLLKHGEDINAMNTTGWTALDMVQFWMFDPNCHHSSCCYFTIQPAFSDQRFFLQYLNGLGAKTGGELEDVREKRKRKVLLKKMELSNDLEQMTLNRIRRIEAEEIKYGPRRETSTAD